MFGLSGFKEVDPGYVEELAGKGAHLIDVRTAAEVAQGVIDGAIHLRIHGFERLRKHAQSGRRDHGLGAFRQ